MRINSMAWGETSRTLTAKVFSSTKAALGPRRDLAASFFRIRSLHWALAFALLLATSTLWMAQSAEISYETVTAKGDGPSRATAIEKGLLEAISKVSGVAMDAAVAHSLATTESESKGKSNYESKEAFSEAVKKLTKGLVSAWEISSEGQNGDRYQVELSVTVARITGAGTHPTRKTLVVLPFRVSKPGSIEGRVVPTSSLSTQIRDSLTTYLTISRKFAVLDDTYSDVLNAASQDRDASMDTVQLALQAANKLKAEYIVTGLADGFAIRSITVAAGGMNMAMKSLDGVVQLRVLKVENGQTILASYFLLNELPNVNLNGSTPEFSVFDSVGKAMASRILDFIYPLKISGITGSNEVAIDRGGEGMSEGDVYDVFKIGDPLKDPTTGESMGFVETKVSTIELVRVLPKVSYAKVISKREPINIEYICRRSVGNSASNSRKTKPQSNPNDLDNLFK